MKNKLGSAFLISYLLSYIFLAFEYINVTPPLSDILKVIAKEVGLNNVSLTVFFIFFTVFLSLSIYLITYFIIIFVVKRVSKQRFDPEKMNISLLLSETLSNTTALFILLLFPKGVTILVVIIPILNLLAFYWLLRQAYGKAIMIPALAVKGLLYLINFVLLLTGVINLLSP